MQEACTPLLQAPGGLTGLRPLLMHPAESALAPAGPIVPLAAWSPTPSADCSLLPALPSPQQHLELPSNPGMHGKRGRLRWTPSLHQQFVCAVAHLGGAFTATPKRILEVMGVPELTLFHLKSHLQKYRSLLPGTCAGGNGGKRKRKRQGRHAGVLGSNGTSEAQPGSLVGAGSIAGGGCVDEWMSELGAAEAGAGATAAGPANEGGSPPSGGSQALPSTSLAADLERLPSMEEVAALLEGSSDEEDNMLCLAGLSWDWDVEAPNAAGGDLASVRPPLGSGEEASAYLAGQAAGAPPPSLAAAPWAHLGAQAGAEHWQLQQQQQQQYWAEQPGGQEQQVQQQRATHAQQPQQQQRQTQPATHLQPLQEPAPHEQQPQQRLQPSVHEQQQQQAPQPAQEREQAGTQQQQSTQGLLREALRMQLQMHSQLAATMEAQRQLQLQLEAHSAYLERLLRLEGGPSAQTLCAAKRTAQPSLQPSTQPASACTNHCSSPTSSHSAAAPGLPPCPTTAPTRGGIAWDPLLPTSGGL